MRMIRAGRRGVKARPSGERDPFGSKTWPAQSRRKQKGSNMRILALDHGTRRIGVAVSDEMKIIATPLEYIPAEPRDKVIERLQQLIRDKEVELILIGLPRNMDG